MSKRYGNNAGRRFSEACGNERLSCSFRAGLKVPSVNRQLRTNERRNRIKQCTAEDVTLLPRWKTQSSVGMEAIEVHVKDLRYAAIGNTFPQSSQLGSHIRTRTLENEQCIPSINKSPPWERQHCIMITRRRRLGPLCGGFRWLTLRQKKQATESPEDATVRHFRPPNLVGWDSTRT